MRRSGDEHQSEDSRPVQRGQQMHSGSQQRISRQEGHAHLSGTLQISHGHLQMYTAP